MDRRVEQGKVGLKISLVEINQKEKVSHLLGKKGRHHSSDQRFSRIKDPCVVSATAGTEGEKDKMARMLA